MHCVESDDIAKASTSPLQCRRIAVAARAMQRVKGNDICDICDIAVSCRFAIFCTSDDAQRHCFPFSPGLQFFFFSLY